MKKENILKNFPMKWLKAEDGLAITAAIWKTAHDYHRHQLHYHSLLQHRPGIVLGLEIVASDPPDQTVYIMPGIAIDPAGHVIVIPEPETYDFGRDMDGLLYLILSYGEALVPKAAVVQAPTSSQAAVQTDTPPAEAAILDVGPDFMRGEYAVHARPTLPQGPYIELARVIRDSKTAAVINATAPAHPVPNALDLRFRLDARPPQTNVVRVAVCHVGGAEQPHAHGMDVLAHTLNRTQWHVIVDEVTLATALDAYTLVYLVGSDTFSLNKTQMDHLYHHINHKGTLLLETHRGSKSAESDFKDLLQTLGLKLAGWEAHPTLLHTPHLFAAPPAGFLDNGSVQIGEGVILSTFDYGCLWQGQQTRAHPSREAIRTAQEWGENILHYAQQRKSTDET